MPERNLTATRITFLELGDEQRMVREGHALLDEKRMLIAAEILAGLRRYAALRREWLDLNGRGRDQTPAGRTVRCPASKPGTAVVRTDRSKVASVPRRRTARARR